MRRAWWFKVVCLARQMHGRANQQAQRILYTRASWRLREQPASVWEKLRLEKRLVQCRVRRSRHSYGHGCNRDLYVLLYPSV